jgi:hypothetical protein
MKKIIVTTILIFILSMQFSFATTLKGLVRGYNNQSKTYYPLSNIDVYLYIWNGSQWVQGANAKTDIYGIYYFYNVLPGYYYYIGTYYGQNIQIFVDSPQIFEVPPITILY